MADQDQYKTRPREVRTTEPSGTSMALIVGGLVVAVGFVLWLIFGGSGPVITSPTDDSVTIEPATVPNDQPSTPAPGSAPDTGLVPDATAPITPDATAPAPDAGTGTGTGTAPTTGTIDPDTTGTAPAATGTAPATP